MSEPAATCPVCGAAVAGTLALAEHLVAEAAASDGAHIMWLNRKVTKHETTPARLAELLERGAAGQPSNEERIHR